MITVATLGPSVRLVVFKFQIKSRLVPDFIPRLPINRSGFASTSPGKEVLTSTPDVWLAGLQTSIMKYQDYVFVGARAYEKGDGRSDVRFTLCHGWHVNNIPPHPTFTKNFVEFVNFFSKVTWRNLWSVQAYLNPYLLENGAVTEDSVLLLDCAGRKEVVNNDGSNVMVYERREIRDGFNKGIGPKIPLLNKANNLKLIDKKVQVVMP